MAIGPERMAHMVKMLRLAISDFYGDRVPDVTTFKNRRRKSFMEQLEIEVNAEKWRKLIADAVQFRGTRQAVVTRLENERRSKITEMDAAHRQQLAELKAKQERELAQLSAHYEPAVLEAETELKNATDSLQKVQRESYFAGMKAEDDNRRFYGTKTIEEAISERVDQYIDQNLGIDSEGQAVELRVHQENLCADIAYIAEKVPELREVVLEFIKAGKLPQITIEAWGIENGKDVFDG